MYRLNKISALRIFSFLLFLWIFTVPLTAQETTPGRKLIPVCIAFYNVENLFDTIPQSGDADAEFTPGGLNKWNSQRYYEKLDRLAEVISKIGTDLTPDGPAVIGLCEIENESVLLDLVKQPSIAQRNYQIVFIQGRDRRINNALLYNPRYFSLKNAASVPVLMEDTDFRTRNHLVVSGMLMGEEMHFIVNHWPSRSGGERRSAPRRIAAAHVARATVDSLKSLNVNAKVILMGDFNDDPKDASVAKYLNSAGDKTKLKEGQLFNPYVNLHRMGVGSLAYRDSWNLFDQVIMTQSLIYNEGFRFHEARVFNKPFLRQPTGRFKDYPFRSYGGGVYLGGYSDHFPAYIFLVKEIK
jgi:hypothetical protein